MTRGVRGVTCTARTINSFYLLCVRRLGTALSCLINFTAAQRPRTERRVCRGVCGVTHSDLSFFTSGGTTLGSAAWKPPGHILVPKQTTVEPQPGTLFKYPSVSNEPSTKTQQGRCGARVRLCGEVITVSVCSKMCSKTGVPVTTTEGS